MGNSEEMICDHCVSCDVCKFKYDYISFMGLLNDLFNDFKKHHECGPFSIKYPYCSYYVKNIIFI